MTSHDPARPDQLWPEGVPHPTSPPPPRVRDPHGAKPEGIREAKAALAGQSEIVRLADVMNFRAVLQGLAKSEADDHARFTSHLDVAIARKAYWRHDALTQCLQLLDSMVIRQTPAPTPASKGQE